MAKEISDFKQTAEALNEIDAAIEELQLALSRKRESTGELKETARRSVARIDELINKLNTVLEDGSGNGNN